MWVIQNSDSLITALYQGEKTDENTLLSATSFLSKEVCPKARWRGSCHFVDDFKMKAEGMKTRFQQTSYPNTWVRDANEEALKRKTRFE